VTDHALFIRAATAADLDFLEEMLCAAVNWSPRWKKQSRARIMSAPATARYLAGWPRDTDLGVVADQGVVADLGVVADAGGRPTDGQPAGGQAVGAAWLRFFAADDPGYGFVAPDVPELTIGVAAAWRGRGVGRALLRALAGQARASGITRISLNVERENFAQRLYLSEGYRIVAASGPGSDAMVKDLR